MQSDAMMAVYGTYWNDGKQNRQYEQDAKENEDYHILWVISPYNICYHNGVLGVLVAP